jgi:hypothetical protein
MNVLNKLFLQAGLQVQDVDLIATNIQSDGKTKMSGNGGLNAILALQDLPFHRDVRVLNVEMLMPPYLPALFLKEVKVNPGASNPFIWQANHTYDTHPAMPGVVDDQMYIFVFAAAFGVTDIETKECRMPKDVVNMKIACQPKSVPFFPRRVANQAAARQFKVPDGRPVHVGKP